MMTESDFQTFEAVGAFVVVLDVDGKIIYWNKTCSDLTGYSLEEVRGRQFWDFLLAPEEVEPVKAVFAKLRTAEHQVTSANYWVTKAGVRRWIAWSHTRTKGPDGQVQYLIKTGIDRTERKQAEDRLSGIISIAADAIISFDNEQRVVLYNQGAERIFGWSAAEVMGKPLDLLLPERFRNLHRQYVRRFASGDVRARQMGESRSAIFGLRKNGEEFPAQAAISKLDVEGSRLFTVVLRDITEQKRREKERQFLAEAGAALAASLDSEEALTTIARLVVQELAECCIVDLVDRSGKLRRLKVLHRDPAKAALCETLQRIPLDRRRRHLVSSVVESKQPCLMAELPSQYLESIAQDDEYLRALRELAPRSLIAVPLLGRREILGALLFVSSHPSRRYGQEDLRLAEELAYRAALAIEKARLYENTREANQQVLSAAIRAQELMERAVVAQARAEGSERELREVAEFREMFIGIVGHDLRNPLASIQLAATSMLQKSDLAERDQKTLLRIINSSQRMTRMISQLLDLTRARLGGGFPLEPKPTDLGEVCRTVVEEFQDRTRLEVEGDVTGTWDPDRLEEVLSNIAGNAIEHADPGTPVVVKAQAAGAEVVVEISNHGNPIPPDLLPSIFEPFRRGKQREKSATGNLGLGLFIAKQIVLSHGGTLEAHSSDGTTTFVIRLTRDARHGGDRRQHREPENSGTLAPGA